MITERFDRILPRTRRQAPRARDHPPQARVEQGVREAHLHGSWLTPRKTPCILQGGEK